MTAGLAVIIVAALPYADRLADKITADRRDKRKHQAAKGKEAGQ